MKTATLRKLSDDKFEGKHPNGIYEGYAKQGLVLNPPIVGESCIIAGLYTSNVTEIVKEEGNKIVFKTLNSTYELTYDDQEVKITN
jgi:hypothetical protein